MIEKTNAMHEGFANIENTLLKHPEWININQHIEQKKA
jgi:hypothetical protein